MPGLEELGALSSLKDHRAVVHGSKLLTSQIPALLDVVPMRFTQRNVAWLVFLWSLEVLCDSYVVFHLHPWAVHL